MLLRSTKLILFLNFLGILLLPGCALLQPVPTGELATFNESLTQTRVVGEQVLQTWDQARRTLKERDEKKRAKENAKATGHEPLPFPETFNAREVLKVDQEPDAVLVRLLAFDTVGQYTDVLVTLAEGRSVAQVQTSADRLRSNLGTVAGLLGSATIPGLAAAEPLIKTLIGALERARTRQEFRNAVEEGAPVVSKILAFLIDDASEYYPAVLVLENEKRLKLERRIIDAVGAIIRIVEDHGRPTDPILLPGIFARIKAVLSTLVPPLEPRALVARGSKPFSNLAKNQVLAEAERMEAANGERLRIVEGLNAYHALLTTYVRLLDQTDSNLQALVAALDRPFDVRAGFESTLGLALQARREIQTVRDSL